MHVFEKLLATEYPALAPSVRAALLAEPELALEVRPVGGRFVLATAPLPWTAPPRAYFPKLGVKSWRDSGHLKLLQRGQAIRPRLEALLAAPTRAQRLAAQAWQARRRELRLFLIPYVNFSQLTEARYLCTKGQVSFVSACLRGASARLFESARPQLCACAASLCRDVTLDRMVLDLCLDPMGQIRLIDVNPALTPKDIEFLANSIT